jgi:D-xylose transport system permease protein
MYAIGANPEAARRAGINVQRVRRIAFTFSAMTAGIAGLALMGVSAAGQFAATAIVLLVAAAGDALVRRRGSTGAL